MVAQPQTPCNSLPPPPPPSLWSVARLVKGIALAVARERVEAERSNQAAAKKTPLGGGAQIGFPCNHDLKNTGDSVGAESGWQT